MRNREMIMLVQAAEDVERIKNVNANLSLVDVTDLVDLRQYEGLARTGVSQVLAKRMPADTHQFVYVIFPKREGETDQDWERRGWMDPVISIMLGGFNKSLAVTRTGEF